MNQLSKSSQLKLATCHPNLQLIVKAVLEEMPLQVIWGERGEADQNKAFSEGKSKLKFPDSKHNKHPSLAVDIMPLDEKGKLDWNRLDLVDKMLESVQRNADKLGIEIRLGRDFKFKDLNHVELVHG